MSEWIAEVYAVSGAIVYLAHLLVVLSVTNVRVAHVARLVAGGMRYVAAWVALGVAIVLSVGVLTGLG